ncbi:hypothetical protein AN958_02803, partial [Leucoagaricus sp. SymC.cos]
GNGPLSKRGRKVIQDVVHVIEAVLQFGMEKNGVSDIFLKACLDSDLVKDDDLLQDLFSQLSQIETDESPISLETAQDARKKMHQMRKQAGKVNEDVQQQVPTRSEVSEDAKTIVKALKSLLSTFLTSSVFRLILADAIAIGRELMAHAASDVSTAALRVHDIAKEVEHNAESADFGRSAELRGNIEVEGMAASLIEEGKSAASDLARDVRVSVRETRKECETHVTEAEEDVKQKLLARIQQMVVRAQEDSSSQRAIIAILHVIRKYAHKFAFTSQETVDSVREAAADPSSHHEQASVEGPQEGMPIGFTNPPSYPPQPYGSPLPKTLIPGIEIDSPHLQYFLQDAKVMLERIARGHKIDGMMKTFGDIIKHSVTAPRDLGKNMEKLAQEKLYHDADEASGVGTTKHTEHTRHWMDEAQKSAEDFAEHDNGEHSHSEERTNLFSMYFSSVGKYLDRALTRPGWATSKAGQKSLETLYDATQELLQVAGEVVADEEEIIREGVDRAKDLEQAEEELREGRDTDVHRVTDQWVQDIAKFLKQAGDYVDAMEQDRTTRKLIRALEELRDDAEDLFGTGRQEMGKAAGKLKTKIQRRARSSGTGKLGLYTQWLGWALPRLLHLLPLGAIPVPRVEVKTENIECAIDVLWIRGYDKGGIGGKLVPDEVIMKHWTEMKVSLAEGLGAAAVGANDAQYRMRLAGGPGDRAVPGIEATSRMRVQMDGIKACVRGMGYYFKYNGSFLEYEDEGVLSIDLGTATGGGRHSGFGLDIELEMDKGDVEIDLHAANAMTGVPILIVEDVDRANSDSDLDPDIPPNFDVQEAVYKAGHRQHIGEHHHTYSHAQLGALAVGSGGPSKLSIDLTLANVIPLFRVLDVHVDMRGVKFRIDNSRHWMLNKMFIEPFAGSLVRAAAKHALEERIRKALEAMSTGMAVIMMEAKERATRRRAKYLSMCETVVERGPEIFAYYTGAEPVDRRDRARRKSVHTETHTELTGRGVVFTKQTHTHIEHQPLASGSMVIPPPGLTDDEGNIEDFGLLREQEIEGESNSTEDEQIEEVTVAVGAGAQLFPGKGGPYGIPKNTKNAGKAALQEVREGVEHMRGEMQEGYQKVKADVQKGYENAKGKERRFCEGREREREDAVRDWRSSAFDF